MELLGHRCVCLYLLLMPNCFPCCMYRFTLASGIYRNCAYLPMFNNCQLFFFFCQFSGNKMDPYCDFFFLLAFLQLLMRLHIFSLDICISHSVKGLFSIAHFWLLVMYFGNIFSLFVLLLS